MNIAQTIRTSLIATDVPRAQRKREGIKECVMHRLRKGEDKEQVQKDGKRMEADNIIMKEV